MTGTNIIEQCDQMTDEELIRALTITKNEYTEEFHQVASDTLKKRGKHFETILNQVEFRFNEGNPSVISITEATQKLMSDFNLWDTGRFINSLKQSLTIQKASRCWSGSYACEDGSDFFIARSDSRIENILKKFLSLENWQQEISDNYVPERWVKLVGVNSYGFLNRLCQDLAEKQVPSCIKIALPGQKACNTEGCDDGGPIQVFVEKADIEIAENVHQTLSRFIDSLYEQAEALDGSDETEKELEIYDKLFELVPDDEMVAFNRGVILYDMEKYEEAADSFIVSAFNRNDEDIRSESETYLLNILDELPENLSILHSLASLAMEYGEAPSIESYYRKIIEIEPKDPLAHLNLGHFYFANTSDDEKVKHHFNIFLALSPESDEAEEVRDIIEELN